MMNALAVGSGQLADVVVKFLIWGIIVLRILMGLAQKLYRLHIYDMCKFQSHESGIYGQEKNNASFLGCSGPLDNTRTIPELNG